MQRFTISLEDDLAERFDELIARRGYRHRSEAVRDLLRRQLDHELEHADPATPCIGNLSYVYNHHERELADRLLALQHEHHDLAVSSMHVHLDHEHCLETLVLRGPARQVRQFAERLIAERGVHHGALNLVLTEAATRHQHGDGRPHVHARPRH